MSTSEKAVKIRDTIVAQINKITKIHGDITPSQIDTLEEEIGSILTWIKLNHFKECQKYGHLAVILREATYRTVWSRSTKARTTSLQLQTPTGASERSKRRSTSTKTTTTKFS